MFISSRYGWIIVFISGLILFFSGPGQTFNVSVFIDSYIQSEGWSRSAISGFYSLATLSAGLLMPLTGRFIDKKGHRFMTVVITALLAFACIWMSFMANPWMLLVGFLMIRLFGQGSMTLLSTTLIPKWFSRKQGIAMSIAAVGGVAGSAFIPMISNSLILNYGTVFAWRFWAIGLIAVMAPLGILLIRNSPEDIGMAKDGLHQYEADNSISGHGKNPSVKSIDSIDWSPKEATKSRIFWMMIFCMLVPSMINTGIVFHIVSIFGEKGFPSTFSAMILGVTAAMQFPVTFLAGWVCDRFPIHKVKAFNYIVLALAMLILIYSRSQLFLLVYALIHGVFMGFDGVSTSVWWPKSFGLKHLCTIRGMGMTAMVIGSALGPLPFGFAYDIFGNYSLILLIMLLFPALAFLAAITSPPQLNNVKN
jgi:MFS family permease